MRMWAFSYVVLEMLEHDSCQPQDAVDGQALISMEITRDLCALVTKAILTNVLGLFHQNAAPFRLIRAQKTYKDTQNFK